MTFNNLLKSLEYFFFDRHPSMTILIKEVCPASIEVLRPIPVSVRTEKNRCIARFDPADMEISGSTESDAVGFLPGFIASTWSDLVSKDPREFSNRERELFLVLSSYIASRNN